MSQSQLESDMSDRALSLSLSLILLINNEASRSLELAEVIHLYSSQMTKICKA
jgi:hypothetical protein